MSTPSSRDRLSGSSSVPLAEIERYARQCNPHVRRTGKDRLELAVPPFGVTELRVVPVGEETADHQRVADVVRIRTPLDEFLPHLGVDAVSALNAAASLGAIVPDAATGRLCVESRLSSFVGDADAWAALYGPLVAIAFVTQLESVVKAWMYAQMGASQESDEAQTIERSAWYGAELERACRFAEKQGLFALGDAAAMTLEYPWDPGAVTAMARLLEPGDPAGGRTSLLQLRTEERHPALGAGLLVRLDLPVVTDGPPTGLAGFLNARELAATDAPPFFGAWTARPDGGPPTFVSFWPNCLCAPGSAINLMAWMYARSHWAWAQLEEENSQALAN